MIRKSILAAVVAAFSMTALEAPAHAWVGSKRTTIQKSSFKVSNKFTSVRKSANGGSNNGNGGGNGSNISGNSVGGDMNFSGGNGNGNGGRVR